MNAKLTRRLIIAGSIIGILLFALVMWHFVLLPQIIRGSIAKTQPPPATVTAEEVQVETWLHRLNAIGTLTAVQAINVSPQVAGIVDEVVFEGGHDVRKGDLLVRLNIAVEKADLASSQATLREATLEFERQSDLVRRGSTAQARLDESQAKRDTAAAAVERIQAVIDQKTIKAPFAGRLGIRQVDLGQYVSAGMALVSLQSLDPIYADFPVPEKNADLLRTGQPVEATFDTFPGEKFTGTVETVDARVNKETRTLLVRARIGNRQRKLLPGMFANVNVLIGEPKAVFTVPRTAITYSLYGDSVFVAKKAPPPAEKPGQSKDKDMTVPAPDSLIVERRFVRVGEARDNRVAILEGINRGETIVTSGQLKLQQGGQVRIDNASALQPPEQRPKQ